MNKTIIIYHSYTQNTEKVANMIKEQLGCDILKLNPKKAFSTDYQSVVDEWQNNSIKNEVEIEDINIDLSKYDNIILGSPIWWYTITPVISTFLKKYNLEGKNIYPFVTSAGWFGHSLVDIKKLCKNANVKSGLQVTFDEDYNLHKIVASKPKIEDWVNSIK